MGPVDDDLEVVLLLLVEDGVKDTASRTGAKTVQMKATATTRMARVGQEIGS